MSDKNINWDMILKSLYDVDLFIYCTYFYYFRGDVEQACVRS